MEHILQFAISIDDNTIKQRIEDSAVKQLSNDMKNSVADKMFKRDGSFTFNVETIIKDVLKEYVDEIINQSVKIVVDSIKHSKKYKDALVKVVEEMK